MVKEALKNVASAFYHALYDGNWAKIRQNLYFLKNACISKKIVFLELGSPLHCEIWTVGTSSANLGMYRGILEISFFTMRGQKRAIFTNKIENFRLRRNYGSLSLILSNVHHKYCKKFDFTKKIVKQN